MPTFPAVLLTLGIVSAIVVLGVAHILSGDVIAPMLTGIITLVIGGHGGVALGKAQTENAIEKLK